jgi:hypothetical protein
MRVSIPCGEADLRLQVRKHFPQTASACGLVALLLICLGGVSATACGARAQLDDPAAGGRGGIPLAGSGGIPFGGSGGSGGSENPCGGAICGPHAHCQTVSGAPTCVCDAGFTGDGFVCVAGCADTDLGGVVPNRIAGSTLGQNDFHTASSCGAISGSPDYVALFEAPQTGSYVFDTFGSGYDTVLAVLEGICAGREICNDDTEGTQSELTLALAQGQTVTVVVDGYGGSTGPFVLNVYQLNQGQCPHEQLVGWPPFTRSGSTAGQASFHATSCGAAESSPDYTYVFTAPASGEYVFDTNGSMYDTVLALLAGYCEGRELACNDDWEDVDSRLSVYLDAGQTVTVVVTGFGGDSGQFVLNVTLG